MAGEPIFTVTNHHAAAAGTPPRIDDTIGNAYLGYYENEHGDQAIFVYNRTAKQATLYVGDANWEKPWQVVNGVAEGLVLTSREQAWLKACWDTATYFERAGS